MEALYRERLPLLPGAVQAVRAIAGRWPVGLASSSNREIIDLFLTESGLHDALRTAVSSEEVPRGKPAPDVYLETARRLDVEPRACVAVEDSSNGCGQPLRPGCPPSPCPTALSPGGGGAGAGRRGRAVGG